ncbi:MAG: hypothetical protein ACRCZ4_11340 [Plesiomonas sp.]|uniref:hypothetical protein n=1 Tax=Plesiomonas sp. TaxID=2486279 RepID=UPI003F341D9F
MTLTTRVILIAALLIISTISGLYLGWPITISGLFIVLLFGYNLYKRSKPDCGCGCGSE